MKIGAFEFTMVMAFLIMLSVKVMDVGIGSALSWWIVLSPLYGPFLAMFILVAIGLMFAGIYVLCGFIIDWFRNK